MRFAHRDHQGCEVETLARDGVGFHLSHSLGSPPSLIEIRVFPATRRIGWINRFNPTDNVVRNQYGVSQTFLLQPARGGDHPQIVPFRENDTRARRSRAFFGPVEE
jgi:hypothetical protein